MKTKVWIQKFMRGKSDIWKINVGRSLRISKLSCIRRSNGFVLYILRCGGVSEVRRERPLLRNVSVFAALCNANICSCKLLRQSIVTLQVNIILLRL